VVALPKDLVILTGRKLSIRKSPNVPFKARERVAVSYCIRKIMPDLGTHEEPTEYCQKNQTKEWVLNHIIID